VRLVRFRDVIDVDCPRAMAELERMLKALDAYRQVSSPAGEADGAAAAEGQAVTRQLEDAPAAKAATTAESEGGQS
jgi:hypothetical protein